MMVNMDKLATDKALGVIYRPEATIFRLWAPVQTHVQLALYENADIVDRTLYEMEMDPDGVFEVEIFGDLDGYYYAFILNGLYEVTDPYATAMTRNSRRSAVADFSKTNPEGWQGQEIPRTRPSEAIIVELSVKDYTADVTSGADHRGKFLGLAQSSTRFGDFSTGIDHLLELGVTHVHLLPVYDFITVDESNEAFFDDDNYNWGYDPEHYNVVEGSYATDSNDPKTRIKELKELILALHKAGIAVVVDVVYNHTFRTLDSNFQQIMPAYYHRTQADGTFSNGSGCGNEFASEKPMGRKFVIDSLLFWQKEYKIDGFRFDLMALIDIDTIVEAIHKLKKANPNVLIYGEPWMALSSPLPMEKQILPARQQNKGFALFNGPFRDALKGDNDGYSHGWVQGHFIHKRAVETGICGSIAYDGKRVGMCSHPTESINYFNSHDNLILEDKLQATIPDPGVRMQVTKLCFAILLTSQGIPFFHGGNEFLRSKKMVHNAYNKPLHFNAVDWSLKAQNKDLIDYVAALIRFRKAHPLFRMETGDEVRTYLKFIEGLPSHLISYSLCDDRQAYLVMINGSAQEARLDKEALEQVEAVADQLESVCIFNEDGACEIRVDAFICPPRSLRVFKI